MASKLPPVKNAGLVFSTVLYAQSDNQIKAAPTLAAGDVKVSKDNGATANISTLPSEDPASSGIVKITLSATEMNADEVAIVFKDASGDEWHSQAIVIHTIASGQQFDDLSILTAAAVNTEADTALSDYDPPTKAELDSGLAGLNDPTAAAIRTEIDSNSTQLAAILADTGTDGVALSATVKQAIADEILKRGMSNVEDTADATSLAALVLAAFESVISGATWTIYKTDHSTTFTTRTVTTSGAANPIVEVT